MRKLGSALIAFSLILAAIYEFRNDISNALHADFIFLGVLIYFFVATMVIGIILIVISYLREKIPEFLSENLDPYLDIQSANRTDLQIIDSLSSVAFGDTASNLTQIEELYNRAPDTFWKVVDDRNQKISGYFCVFRITKKGESQVKRGTFYGACPDETAILKTSKKNVPIYVGAIYGKSLRAKAVALAGLSVYLSQLNPPAVYAKAATKDGLRILTRRGFQPLNVNCSGVGDFFYFPRSTET